MNDNIISNEIAELLHRIEAILLNEITYNKNHNNDPKIDDTPLIIDYDIYETKYPKSNMISTNEGDFGEKGIKLPIIYYR